MVEKPFGIGEFLLFFSKKMQIKFDEMVYLKGVCYLQLVQEVERI